jgi:hypothetical protein
MTQNQILEMIRTKAASMPLQAAHSNDIILALAKLLAESRGRLSKENFETLVHIGGVLYKSGLAQYNARQDVADIMQDAGRKSENR